MDECVLYKNDVIFIVYVDDGIFVGPYDAKITSLIKQLGQAGLDDEGPSHAHLCTTIRLESSSN